MPCCTEHVDVLKSMHNDDTKSFTQSPDAPPSYAPDLKLEPVHMDVSLTFEEKSLKEHYFFVTVVHHIVCHRPHSTIDLNAESFETVEVKDVTNDGKNNLSYRYDGKVIRLNWKDDLVAKETRKVQISYKVNDPISSVCWNYENNTQRLGDFAVLDSESERCRYWLACVDFPAVRTTITTSLTTPSEWSSYGQGLLTNTDKKGDQVTRTFNLDYPCPSYIICWAVGDLIIYKEENTKIPVAYIAPRGTSMDNLKLTFDETPQIIDWLEKRVGVPFPFPRYYQIITPKAGGAMENITLVTFDYVCKFHSITNDLVLMDNDFARDYKHIMDKVNLHECTHSYFGDAVVMRHFESVWLKESWATFMQAVWLGETRNDNEMRYELFLHATNYMNECEEKYLRPIVNRVYDSSWDMFDRHTYPGGSFRLHMLRRLLGDEDFWTGVRNYVSDNLKKTVETEDFRKSLERASGLNLSRFFDQWLYSKGYPKLKVEYKHDATKNSVQITASQTQEDKKVGVPVFHATLKVGLGLSDGTVTIASAEFNGDKAVLVTKLPEGVTVDYINVDPDVELLFSLDFNPGEDILKNTFVKGDIMNRIHAAKTLIKKGGKGAIEFIVNNTGDQMWGVRVEVAKELGKQKGSAWCRDAICKLVPQEKEPKALFWFLNSSFRDSKIKQVLEAMLKDTSSLTPMTHAQLLQAYSNQTLSDEEKSSFLKQLDSTIENDQRLYALVRRGAYRAIGNLETSEAYKYLLHRLEADTFGECKEVIISSLAHCASNMEEVIKNKTVKILTDLLRSWEEHDRRAAIDGLLTLKSQSSVGAIESTRPSFATQYHSWLDRKVKSFSSAAKNGAGGVQKDVDNLRELIKKLESKVEALESAK